MNYRLLFLGSLFMSQLFFWLRTLSIRHSANPFYTVFFTMMFFFFEGTACILYFITIKKITGETNTEQQLTALEKEKELQDKQQEKINELRIQTEKMQSSISDQLKNIKDHLQNGNTENALNICNDFKNHFSQMQIPSYCNNSVLNAILHTKYEEAVKENICIEYQLLLPHDLDFPETIMPSIFFNLLDNGIHACQQSGSLKPFIQFHTRFHANFLHIYMENSKNPAAVFSQSKEFHSLSSHGYGLTIMEEIADSYDGSYEWLDRSDTFESILMLRYKNN